MMKEFRFEPASQMITVEEGQNLGIDITGIKTAYRCDDGAQRVICYHGGFFEGGKGFFSFHRGTGITLLVYWRTL